MKRLSSLLALLSFVAGFASGGDTPSRVTRLAIPLPESALHYADPGTVIPPGVPAFRSGVGSYTGLTTRYDYQANGGACQMIRVNPANGNIHIIFHTSEDTIDITGGPTRGTLYAFSTDGGGTWNNFNFLRVPSRRSGFPSLDLGRGSIAGGAIIANHAEVTGVQSLSHVDFPEGGGAFVELSAPPLVTGGTTEPIWPHVAGASDGSIVMHSSQNIQNPTPPGSNQITRTTDFASWSPWVPYPGANDAGGGYVTVSNGTGKVGSLLNANAEGVFWLESTNNGATWPAAPVTIYPPVRFTTAETLQAWSTSDVVYNGETPLYAVNTSRTDGAGNFFYEGSRVEFWSGATGFVDAAPWDSSKYLEEMTGQDFHLCMGWPSIGISGSTIFIAYMAFQPETANGFNFGDIWYVMSEDGGLTWSEATNLTNTPSLDERYPSVSKWNEAGFANMVWQEDPTPGAWVRGQGLNARARQVFLKFQLPTVDVRQDGGFPAEFRLSQNYPNPFNPATTIDYAVPRGANVRLVVYNALGQEVATLVDGYRNAGSYAAEFSASAVASGVYFYTLTAGEFTSSRKMVLMK